MKKILFLDTVHPCLQKELETLGYKCDLKISESRKKIETIIHEYFGIVIRSRIALDKKILSLAKNLKFIARSGSGMENIDLNFAEKKGILCINSPEGNRDAVAEHALGMLLSLFNKITIADNEIRNGKWNREKNRGIELGGKTIGIIGFGNTGKAFTKRLKGFDVRILIYDIIPFPTIPKRKGVSLATMDEIFEQSDILSLHIPLTEKTKYLVNDSFIKKFKKNIFLINTSRGPIVKTDDLVKNLKSGKILGACLDVIEYEENSFETFRGEARRIKSFEYLKKSENVILTPHVAGWTVESYRKLSQVLADKIKRAFHQ